MTKGIKSRLLARLIAFFSVALLLPAVPLQAQSVRPDLTLTILHTNDIHAHDEPFTDHGREVGGMARIGYLIQSIKRRTPNVVAVDAGDIFQGTSFFKEYKGATEVALLNKAGYDIYTIGNHEFDEGSPNLAKQLSAAHFAVISANLDASKLPELAHIVHPYVVRKFDGKPVAFIGAILPDLEKTSLGTGDVQVKKCADAPVDWICPIREQIEQVKKDGIKHIVLVTHCGLELDRQLAAALPDVDAIVGGHSHTRLDKPVIVNRPDGSSCIIVQAGSYGRALGKLTLAFDRDGRLIFPQTTDRLISINSKIPEDKEIAAYVKEKSLPFAKLRDQVLAVATTDFDNAFRNYYGDSPIGDLITDALADAGTGYGATVALHNRGGVRSRIERGLISMEKVEEILPFENKLVFATIPGSTLQKVLEHSVSGHLGSRFLDVHGLKITWDPSAPPYHRIKSVHVLSQNGQYEPLREDAKYKIAINDYNFAGGEGYDFSTATNVEPTNKRLAAFLADYLIKQKKVVASPPTRITAINIPVRTKRPSAASKRTP